MKARADLAMQAKLLAISDARKALAAAEFADAQAQLLDAVEAVEGAKAKVAESYEVWEQGLGSSLLGPQSLRGLATQLLAAESALIGANRRCEAVERETESRRKVLTSAEARLRAERERHTKTRRRSNARMEERRQKELSDRTLNRWIRGQ